MFKSKLWLLLIGVILMTAIAATATNASTITIYADSDQGKDKDPDTETAETESEGRQSETEDTETEDTETEDTETEDTETEDTETEDTETEDTETEDTETEDTETEDTAESEEEAQEQTASLSSSEDGLREDNPGNGDSQPGRVGSHDDDDQTSEEGANRGGTVTDPTITGDPETVDEGDTVSSDCFGKVISHEAQEHKDPESDEGTLGEHSSDPVPELEGNETPRQGIGNQDQGHPSTHGAFNAQFEEEDAENVEENCN